ncbi:uncharacterized protein LOC131928085 [Physella acuta]|uniref:uncharacterized protein LOC131928085 n=1 Tax=Physella acuta TaxID=109671 RepID=UPI0027DC135F|nr:uncharacterized protein LOC131928085 [Physella acuta]
MVEDTFKANVSSIKISMHDNFSFEVTVLCICRGVVSFLGIIGSSLTIRTFVAMGLKDGVTLSFLFLSVSDLLYLISITAASVSYIFLSIELLSHFAVYFPVDPYGVNKYFINTASGFFANTVLTITFLSIARCLSVARPMWFRRELGTRKTAVVFITTSALFCVTTSIPVLSWMGIIPLHDARLNVTRPTFWISPNRKWATYVIWPVRDTALPFAVQLVLIVCALTMRKFLKSALKFRQKHTTSRVVPALRILPKHHSVDHTGKILVQTGVTLSGKELQIIQQMFVLSVLFIVASVPKVYFNTAKLIFPEFSLDGKYGRLYECMDVTKDAFQMLYSCGNTFIYYRYNSKFRALFWRQ